MTRMTPLLERNEQFARTYTPAPLGIPAQQVLIVTCLDHRVDPAIVLGLQLGDAPVIRNAGGRVTQAVIDDIPAHYIQAVRPGVLAGGGNKGSVAAAAQQQPDGAVAKQCAGDDVALGGIVAAEGQRT